MLGVELVRDRKSKEPADAETSAVLETARNKGLILLKAGVFNNVIRFLPPLNISDEQLETGLDILEKSILEVAL